MHYIIKLQWYACTDYPCLPILMLYSYNYQMYHEFLGYPISVLFWFTATNFYLPKTFCSLEDLSTKFYLIELSPEITFTLPFKVFFKYAAWFFNTGDHIFCSFFNVYFKEYLFLFSFWSGCNKFWALTQTSAFSSSSVVHLNYSAFWVLFWNFYLKFLFENSIWNCLSSVCFGAKRERFANS